MKSQINEWLILNYPPINNHMWERILLNPNEFYSVFLLLCSHTYTKTYFFMWTIYWEPTMHRTPFSVMKSPSLKIAKKTCWNNHTSTCKNMNLDTDLKLFRKIYSKWIIDTYVKCKTVKLLESNIGENSDDLCFGSNFLDTIPEA